MQLFSINELVAGYGKIAIVQNFTMNVSNNELVAVIGPNGSGKSTVFKAVFGLAKIMAGRVFFDGEDITNLRGDLIVKRGIGYLPQIRNVFTTMTIAENLELGYMSKRKSLEQMLEKVYNLFPFLKERAGEKAGVLSGGQRQILSLAKTMMSEPQMLILDEPTAGLSPKAATAMMRYIQQLRNDGVSVIIIEQNVRRALQVADKVYVLASGRKVFEGKPDDIASDEELASIYLGLKSST
ncbi:MAG: ABC transporter ATP-binding protein [Nitrososphaerota archaeon]